MKKIVFLDEYSVCGCDLEAVKALGDYTGYDVTAPDQIVERCRDAEAVITNKTVLDAATIDRLPRLRLICVAATGMNNVDLAAAAERSISVRNAVGYSTESVAEATIGSALALLRETVYYDRYFKSGRYASADRIFCFDRPTAQLRGKRWGVVGMGNIGRERRNLDKWFCGSYLSHVPDHYELGYQLCSYAYDKYGENVWDKVAWYGSRNPYVIAVTAVSLRKFYKTSVSQLFRETFDNLHACWDSLPKTGDSALPLRELPDDNYTVYRWPLPLPDGRVLVLKNDFDRPERFVEIDRESGAERFVAYVGSLSTRPALDAEGRVWWTEYRRSKLFEQRVGSQLCCMDLSDGVPRTVAGVRSALYPAPSDDAV